MQSRTKQKKRENVGGCLLCCPWAALLYRDLMTRNPELYKEFKKKRMKNLRKLVLHQARNARSITKPLLREFPVNIIVIHQRIGK